MEIKVSKFRSKVKEMAQSFQPCYWDDYTSTVSTSASMVSGERRVDFITSVTVTCLTRPNHPALHCNSK